MRTKSLILIICLFLGPAHACTVFSAAHDDVILGAANKDWGNLETRALFIAPSEGKYGRVYFGYQIPEGFQNAGGMNNQGLWYDGATLTERTDIRNHYDKPTVKGELCEKALEECATVAEVIALYTQYHTPHWQGHSMWSDRMGNSVIIEYGEEDVVFLHKQNTFQVMTNHYLSDSVNTRWYNCYRYNMSTDLLENSTTVSINSFRSVLNAVHQSGIPPTVYSNIYDLKNGQIYVHNFHNYEEFVIFDLQAELDKGGAYYKLPELFNQTKLLSPLSGELVSAAAVNFIWNGEADSYQLCVSQDSTFSDCVTIEITDSDFHRTDSIILCSLWIPILFIGGFWSRRKNILILLSLLLGLYLMSCSIEGLLSPYSPSTKEHSQIVENLESGEKYYWKVQAAVGDGIVCESIVESFLTKS